MIGSAGRIGCLGVLVSLQIWSASAAQWFVATNGNNSAGGTIDAPWQTIRYGVLNMAPGDTVNIRGGTYPDDGFLIQEFKSGPSKSSPTVVQAYSGESVTYAPHVIGEYSSHGILINGKSNIVLNGFTVDSRNTTSDGLKLTGGALNITVTNMTVFGCPRGMGILTTGPSEGAEMDSIITHCRVITNGWGATTNDNPLHQIYLQTSGMTVENCYIQGATNVGGGTMGIQYFGSAATNGTFRNNLITNCSVGILAGSSYGSNCWIYNNLICGGYSWGISVYLMANVYVLNNTCYTNNAQINVQTSTNVWVENNICVGGYANFVGGIDINGVVTASVQNNIAYGNYCSPGLRGTDFVIHNGSVNISTNANKFKITGGWGAACTDPSNYDVKFVNAAAGDFRLGRGSDAIASARVESIFQGDFQGNLRGTTNWDIGALKYLPSTLVPAADLRLLSPSP
jgi:hypothetical protein